jgi:hypothetical protein
LANAVFVFYRAKATGGDISHMQLGRQDILMARKLALRRQLVMHERYGSLPLLRQ